LNTLYGEKLPIAEGRTAEIFDWEPGTILKLYRDWCPVDWAEYEAGVARLIYNAGVNSPAVKDLVELNGRSGIVYERVAGVSMLSEMNAHPWADIMRTRLLLIIGPKGTQNSISPIIKLFIWLYYQTYFRRIQALIPDLRREQNCWLPVVAAARLKENILPERAALIKTVRAGLS